MELEKNLSKTEKKLSELIKERIAQVEKPEIILVSKQGYTILEAEARAAGFPAAMKLKEFEKMPIKTVEFLRGIFAVTSKDEYWKAEKEWNEKTYDQKAEVLSEVKRTATEELECNACGWLRLKLTQGFFDKLTPLEKKAVSSAQRAKFKIIPGALYTEQTLLFRGLEMTSNFLPKIHDICVKYKLYQSSKIN